MSGFPEKPYSPDMFPDPEEKMKVFADTIVNIVKEKTKTRDTLIEMEVVRITSKARGILYQPELRESIYKSATKILELLNRG